MILQVEDLNRSFGGVQAVKDVSFTVREGMIKAVIGPNGAGKTTLFNLISGTLRPDSGKVMLEDREITGLPPHRIAGMGIARTFQHIRLFPGMTVLENVMIGCHIHGKAGFLAGMLNLPWTWKEERRLMERACEVLGFLSLDDYMYNDALSLPYGQQRILEIARALAVGPRLLLLDEPAAGLNMRETVQMAEIIRKIKEQGITVLLVEHDMSLVMNISDEVLVLSYGEKIADDLPLRVQKDPEVIRVYLGEEDAQD